MSVTLSSPVFSSQQGVHANLLKTIERHCKSVYQKPIPAREYEQFEDIDRWVQQYSKVILDNGCGTGESTIALAKEYPDFACIGVDKSSHRLSKQYAAECPSNVRLVRADLEHFLRLVEVKDWKVQAQYYLYPNPWPKPVHFKRRWHAHPLFPTILRVGGQIELRTNWEIYAREFCVAMRVLSGQVVTMNEIVPNEALSRFESKYRLSGHRLFQVLTDLSLTTASQQPE